jgi:hypothetical protein
VCPGRWQPTLEELTSGFNSQLLLFQEEAIRADLTKHGLVAESATEKVLLRHRAGTQIVLHFERIYAVLYNSQLQALRWLNSQPADVTAIEVLMTTAATRVRSLARDIFVRG